MWKFEGFKPGKFYVVLTKQNSASVEEIMSEHDDVQQALTAAQKARDEAHDFFKMRIGVVDGAQRGVFASATVR